MSVNVFEVVKFISEIVGPVLAGAALVITTRTARRLHEEQQRSARRQHFVPIWEKLILLNRIDTTSPVEPDVRLALNTMELVAACWHAGIVDQEMVDKTFRRKFLELHETINKITNAPPGWGYSPSVELAKSSFIPALNQIFMDHENADKKEQVRQKREEEAKRAKLASG